ncbi:MAG: hypothetical protein M3072_01585 [Candidatus Dormibacteraeota bacterium]|nr:hypothetical protein [Candidatus Dormibacteraeota bacterium]
MSAVGPSAEVRTPAARLSAGTVGLGLGGLTLWGLTLLGPAVTRGVVPPLPGSARLGLLACAVTLGLACAFAPLTRQRGNLIAAGGIALGALAALLVMPDPNSIAIILLLLGVLQASQPGRRTFAVRVRPSVIAAALLALGWLLLRSGGVPLGRAGALLLALGLVAAAALVPYLPELRSDEPASSSPVPWIGLFGPALALGLPARLLPLLSAEERGVFGATLLLAGVLNLLWGVVGAWRAASGTEAWRLSFVAEWGVALIGLGLYPGAGSQTAVLALLSLILVRFPLYLWARPVLLGRAEPDLRGLNVVTALALAGGAPFAGFALRLYSLRAAAQFSWLLAAFLVVAFALWTAHAFRLARTLGRPSRRTTLGVLLTLGLSLALGLGPNFFLAAAA